MFIIFNIWFSTRNTEVAAIFPWKIALKINFISSALEINFLSSQDKSHSVSFKYSCMSKLLYFIFLPLALSEVLFCFFWISWEYKNLSICYTCRPRWKVVTLSSVFSFPLLSLDGCLKLYKLSLVQYESLSLVSKV